MPPGKKWIKELQIEKMVLDGIEHDTNRQVDIIAGGGGVLLPGSHFTYQGVPFEYEYMKGTSLEDAGDVPESLATFFDTRDKMTGKRTAFKMKPRPAPEPLESPPSPPSPPSATAPPSRATTPLRANDDDMRLMDKLCECLQPEWLDKPYTNWRDLVFCLKNISGGRALSIAVKHSRRGIGRDTAADEQATRALWEQADAKGTLGWGSLHHWARLGDPERHHALFKDNYMTLVFGGNRGLADIFATELAGSCVYVANEKVFWLWVEHLALWKPVCEDNITALYMRLMPAVIKKLVDALPKPTESATQEQKDAYAEKRKALMEKKNGASNSMPEPVMKCLRDALNPEVSFRNIDAFELDANPDYFPLSNGVWNFKEGKLEEYSRQHYLSCRLPIAYNPSADTSLIQKAVSLWLKGNKEHMAFFQYWFGYCLTGHITRQDFLILFGKSAGNGKSTWVEEILQEDILGKHFATTFGEDALSRVGGNNDDIFYAFGKRMCIAPESGGESKHTKELHLPTIKRITGGGRVVAEAKFKGKKEGAFQAKVVCVCNELPKMPSNIDNGTRRRTLVLEMNTKFVNPTDWAELTDEERASGDFGLRDPNFIKQLRANKEGTLLWLLQGAARYMAEPQYPTPDSIARFTSEALAASDTERVWFNDGYSFDKVKNKGQSLPFKEIADRWGEAFNVKPTNAAGRSKFLKKVRAIVGDAFVSGDSNHGYTIHCLVERG